MPRNPERQKQNPFLHNPLGVHWYEILHADTFACIVTESEENISEDWELVSLISNRFLVINSISVGPEELIAPKRMNKIIKIT